MTAVDIGTVVQGGRHRHDLGDIAGLADSMTEVGQLQPIVVTSDMHLVAGARRLAAARSLGWSEVDVHVVTNLTDAVSLLRAEADENVCRKAFTPTEAAAIVAAREALLKPVAKQAMSDGGKGGKVGNPSPPVRTREAAAVGLGYSRETIRKVREVQAVAAAPETPEPVRKVAEQAVVDMDRSGKVDAAHKVVKQAQATVEAESVDKMLGLDSDTEYKRLQFRKRLQDDIVRARRGVLAFDAKEVGELSDERQLDALDELARSFTKFAADARRHRPTGLRVVNGGQS